jgi:hypothetical protein
VKRLRQDVRVSVAKEAKAPEGTWGQRVSESDVAYSSHYALNIRIRVVRN